MKISNPVHTPKKKLAGFTLVELIVVITILVILGTIAFISLQGYSGSARDSTRISDISSILKASELYLLKTGTVPPPDENRLTITASGTVIGYQGYAAKNLLSLLRVGGEGKDPLDQKYYTYVTNADYTKYQLLGLLENGTPLTTSIVPAIEKAYAGYETRYPLAQGNSLGVLIGTGSDMYQPLQEKYHASFTGVDIIHTTNVYTAVFGDKSSVSGTGSSLFQVSPIASCKRILESGYSKGDGIYTINPRGNAFSVYCDMSTDGGGWTKMMHANYNSFFSTSDWTSLNADAPKNTLLYSILNRRGDLRIGDAYTFRFQVGRAGNTNDYATKTVNETIWSQKHDPFTESTDGSDYAFIGGDKTIPCGGFNGLHSRYQGFSRATDADLNDNINCWGLQVVPTTMYVDASYKYYTLYFSGPAYDWQILWMR